MTPTPEDLSAKLGELEALMKAGAGAPWRSSEHPDIPGVFYIQSQDVRHVNASGDWADVSSCSANNYSNGDNAALIVFLVNNAPTLLRAAAQALREQGERVKVPGADERGEFVGDIFFGDPKNSTRGTHRWDGSEWVELPDERVSLMELLAKSRERVKVLEEALSGIFKRLDHPLNGGQHVNYFVRWPEVEAARRALQQGGE